MCSPLLQAPLALIDQLNYRLQTFFLAFFFFFFFVQYQVALNVHSCGSVASVFKMTNILISTPVSEVCY